jgi:hypothetical protein
VKLEVTVTSLNKSIAKLQIGVIRMIVQIKICCEL